jgi:hypothetical protein
MSRLIDQLASVYGDLESRYGSDNEVVLELKSALDIFLVALSRPNQVGSSKTCSG